MVLVCRLALLMSFYTFCLQQTVVSRQTPALNNRAIQGLQKIYTRMPLCSTLKPESVTADTYCLSSCGASVTDSSLVCNEQAETWKIRLKIDKTSGFSTSDDCPKDMKRFKCVPYESNEIQCADAAFAAYPEGFSCFTRCGELKCPSADFLTPSVTNDFKLADCQSNYRVRCRIYPNRAKQLIGIPDLTMELQVGSRNYSGAATH